MSRNRISNNRWVTHDEFSEFRADIKGDLTTLSRDIKELAGTTGKTNWSVITSLLSVALTIAALSGGLITYAITAEGKARQIADEFVQDKFHDHIENEYEDVESRNISLLSRVAVLEERSQSQKAEIDNIDVVLQREMRLLDDILQREMGLHVDRLSDLIKSNNEISKQRHDSQSVEIEKIQANRFTAAEGEFLKELIKQHQQEKQGTKND